jgi:hypothetical protein
MDESVDLIALTPRDHPDLPAEPGADPTRMTPKIREVDRLTTCARPQHQAAGVLPADYDRS